MVGPYGSKNHLKLARIRRGVMGSVSVKSYSCLARTRERVSDKGPVLPGAQYPVRAEDQSESQAQDCRKQNHVLGLFTWLSNATETSTLQRMLPSRECLGGDNSEKPRTERSW